MEHFAHVVGQIDDKIAALKLDIKETELHLHKQLNAGVPEEHLSDYYSLLDINEGILSGLNEALSILKTAWLNYTEGSFKAHGSSWLETYHELEKELAEVCLMNESDQDSISIYLDRFNALAATGNLSDKQFDRLNGYIEELILNWGDEN